jgi:hypothetical protein
LRERCVVHHSKNRLPMSEMGHLQPRPLVAGEEGMPPKAAATAGKGRGREGPLADLLRRSKPNLYSMTSSARPSSVSGKPLSPAVTQHSPPGGTTPYLGRTSTGWIAPACGWCTHSITSSAKELEFCLRSHLLPDAHAAALLAEALLARER